MPARKPALAKWVASVRCNKWLGTGTKKTKKCQQHRMISWVSMSRLSTETISWSLAGNSTLWGLARHTFGPTPLGIPSISELSFSVHPPTEKYPSNKNWVEASARSYNWDPPNVELLQSQGAKASPTNKDVGGTGNSVICRHDQGVPEPRSTQRRSIAIIPVQKS